jgi:hypothetical protein
LGAVRDELRPGRYGLDGLQQGKNAGINTDRLG